MKLQCQRYYQCPNCCSVLHVNTIFSSKIQGGKHYYLSCNYCKWESYSEPVGLKSNNINGLLQKLNFYKGRYEKSPQLEHFTKLKEYYKWQHEQQANQEKMEIRAKKKTPSMLIANRSAKIDTKFTIEDLEQQKADRVQEVAALAAMSFNELYERFKSEEEIPTQS